MRWYPEEILLSPTTACNLSCLHCAVKKTKQLLPLEVTYKFLKECNRLGISRLGFTGGEPFLVKQRLYKIIDYALKQNMVFAQIMTNAAWFSNFKELEATFKKLYKIGYDGKICISTDAFHKSNVDKIIALIRVVYSLWQKDDMVSVVYLWGVGQTATENILKKLTNKLKLSNLPKVRFKKIDFSPVGAEHLKNPWDGKWFKEDFCQGPGNVFFVLPNGDVKPCCGYANELPIFTIGNIKRDSAKQLIENFNKNKVLTAIFHKGLSSIREKLIKQGVKFPGKTTNHCYFCHYVFSSAIRRNLL